MKKRKLKSYSCPLGHTLLEVPGTGLYYCYECKVGDWLKRSRAALKRKKSGK